MPTFIEYQAALERCMKAEPPTGAPDYRLSADSSKLADIYGEMAYLKQSERPLEALTAKQRAAFERWNGTVT